MTPSEFYTNQFYSWEYRGRGWFVSDTPVHLEPPFVPYFRHGYSKEQIDDGKRHTLVSKAIELFNGKKKILIADQDLLDYETLELFEYEEPQILKALQVKLPKDRRVTPEKMKALLIMLSGIGSIISFEIIGGEKEIILQFVCDVRVHDTLETYINAYFPNYPLIKTDTYLEGILRDDLSTAVVDYGLKHEFIRSINTAKSFSMDPLIGVLAVLEKLAINEQAGIQILFQPAVNQWTESIVRSVTMHDGSSFFRDVPEAPQLAKEKIQSPLYGVTIRTFAQSEELEKAFQILEKISFALVQASRGSINELIPLATQSYDFQTRVDDIFLRQSHRMGMLLGADELVSLLHFPSESIVSQKLFTASRKTKELPVVAKNKTFILGENTHNGITAKVSLSTEDRLKHTHIIGATGTGKSTLIANLILQDINEGIGVVLFDPHGDLVDDIIARIPSNRIKDIVLVDPSDIEYPVGLNILKANSDIEKEVLSSDLVAAFRRYTTSWGDQMNAVFGNAVLAILENKQGGSLNDLRRLLIEKDFRNAFLKGVSDTSVLYYWQKEYPLLKTNSIGPILTRLDTFLRPKSIRNMVVQKEGIDFEQLLNANKIILLKLSQGLIGVENSFLLGSLMLSKIHQAIFRRQTQGNRNPVFIYLDEFQNFITPSIKEMLSGIRKYQAGLILSHQDLQQLNREDGELLNSVLSNCNTRIVFRVGEPDAKKLKEGFSGFDHSDLQNLGRGEAIVRIEQPQFDCSMETVLMEEVSVEQRELNRAAVIDNSRQKYATSKESVEQMLLETFNFDANTAEKTAVIIKQKPPEQIETQIEPKATPVKATTPIELSIIPETPKSDKDVSTHRYLQTLVKKMAEARGYTAVLEQQIRQGEGSVDVLLNKDNKTTAIEICVTTDPDWEMHNIEKCISAKYDNVVSLCGDARQLEKIRKRCTEAIADFDKQQVHFFTPDALFAFMDQSITIAELPTEQIMKGYRINVSYDPVSEEEMRQKRASVTKVVMDSLRKQKKK